MNQSSPPEPPVGPATPDQRPAALELLWCDLSPADRAQRSALLRTEATPETWQGLLVAKREERLVGAALGQVQAGKSGILVLPRLLPGEPPSTAVRLLAAVNDFLQRGGVRIAQCLLPLPLTGDADLLRATGYQRITDLSYLVSEPAAFPASQPHSPLTFEPCTSELESRLAAIVQQTYQGTLDCPQLNGIRSIEDVLNGYRASGQSDACRWFLVKRGDEDVGCLLLTDYAEQETWELIYMGLKPEARGRGWGTQIARHAQWLTALAGRRRLVVAADAANRPAVRMYVTAGFQLWERRAVFLRVFSEQAP